MEEVTESYNSIILC